MQLFNSLRYWERLMLTWKCEWFSGMQENSTHTQSFYLVCIFNKLCTRLLDTIIYVHIAPNSFCTIKCCVLIGLSTALINYFVWFIYQQTGVITKCFFWWRYITITTTRYAIIQHVTTSAGMLPLQKLQQYLNPKIK